MIRLENVHLTAGNKDLLDDASLHLHPGDKVGLVGRNGAGKTTLIRALLGEHPIDGGHIHHRRGARLGYLPQQAVSGSPATVWDETRSGMTELVEREARVKEAQAAVDAGDDAAIERLANAEAAFQLAGGYAWDEAVGTVLHGLGFTPEDWKKPCNELSGGWQMRTALARLLLSAPDVALLDEPTNHLDLQARSWLADYLRSVPWSTIIVSHDRHLLDRVAGRIVEVRSKKLYSWTGNFTHFLKAREASQAQQESLKEQQDAKIAHLQGFVDRFGAKATKARQAKSRARQIAKIERIEIDAAPSLARISLPEPPASAQRMVRLEKADIGWDSPLIQGLTLEVERGMRIALLGDNGCGKSTLLKTLTGQIPPLNGRRVPGDRVQMGVFHQDLAAALPADARPIDLVADAAPLLPITKVRAVLGALGLKGDAALRPCGALSGGEKARVALATLTAKPHNLLLLDEPTNHLDAETVEVLVRALKSWTGAMVLVSHDRYVVEQLATHVLRVAPPFELKEGIDPTDFERTTSVRSNRPNRDRKTSHQDRKRAQRELERATKRLAAIPAYIDEAEAAVAAVDEELVEAANDWERAAELNRTRDKRVTVVDALYAEWEQLESKIEQLQV